MSELVTLFQVAAPALALLALVGGLVAGVVILSRRFGGRLMRQPRVVTMARHRELLRQIEARRR